MRQRVLLFASWADAVGAPEVEVELPAGATVGDVLDLVKVHAGNTLLPTPAVARNQRYAQLTEAIEPGDELAIIPPVAGG